MKQKRPPWSYSSAHTKTNGSAGFVNINKTKYGTRTVPRPAPFADETSTKKYGVKYWTRSIPQMFKMEVNICTEIQDSVTDILDVIALITTHYSHNHVQTGFWILVAPLKLSHLTW